MSPTHVTVRVDRPLGSRHPHHPDIRYPVNYGFIPGTLAADGEEEDAYILGVYTPVAEFTGTLIARIHREDDVEDKWVVAPEGFTYTESEIRKQTHFMEQFFKITVTLL